MLARGLVVTGKGEGKKLGYPTANIAHTTRGLRAGVFCARVLVGTRMEHGLAVIGMWAQENSLPSVEVYLLDFSGDLYGQELVVLIEEKIRDLARFENTEALLAQIKKDVEDARTQFGA